MSYLLDKKEKRKKFSKIALGVILLFFLFYFRNGIFSGISYTSEIVLHPFLILAKNIEEKFLNIGSYFTSKNSLYLQNQNLLLRLDKDEKERSNYDSVVADNASLKEILGRKDPEVSMVLAGVLAKPNQNPYDVLLIDVGTQEGVKVGDIVFALGDVPIGRISDIYPNSSKVILFSNPGETTQAIVSLPKSTTSADGTVSPSTSGNVFIEIVGRGGGNFEINLPKDFVLKAGDQAILPGIHPYVLAIVQKIISDPRNPSTKVLLNSSVNTQELKFVEVAR